MITSLTMNDALHLNYVLLYIIPEYPNKVNVYATNKSKYYEIKKDVMERLTNNYIISMEHALILTGLKDSELDQLRPYAFHFDEISKIMEKKKVVRTITLEYDTSSE